MLVGSQVSLKYDLDLSLTQVPENLIFYSDEQMTTAFLKENGVIHLDGTFLANDNNKTASRTIYWAWPIETGSTQTEINHNDELDSEWIGSDVIVGINATGRQIMGDPDEEYAVTFDANGGTLQGYGNAEKMTKQIVNGENCGVVPVAKRNGYRFIGWSTSGENPVVENLIKKVAVTANMTKITDGQWYVVYNGNYVDTYIVFRTKTGNEIIRGEDYTLLFNVSNLTDDSNVVYGFPGAMDNIKKLENGINKIHFNNFGSVNPNAYVFDNHPDYNGTAQSYYLSDFFLYKNNGDDYLQNEISNVTPQANTTYYAIWAEEN